MFKNRPFPVTVVCVFLLAYATYFLVTSFAYLNNPETQDQLAQIDLPKDLQIAMMYVNLVVLIVCGMFIMQEANWARWLFLGWGFVAIDYNLYVEYTLGTIPLWQSILRIGIYLTFALILLLPSANEFFAEETWEEL